LIQYYQLLKNTKFPTYILFPQGSYYCEGMWVCCAFCFLIFALAMALSLLLRSESRSHDKILEREPALILKNWEMMLLFPICLLNPKYIRMYEARGKDANKIGFLYLILIRHLRRQYISLLPNIVLKRYFPLPT